MILAAIISILAIAMLCKLLFNLAVYALPLYGGVATGLWLHSTGAGIVVTIPAGIVAGMVSLIIGQSLFGVVRSPAMLACIGLIFAAPAVFAGYHLIHGIVDLVLAPGQLSTIFASLGAAIVGVTAWIRVPNLGRKPVSR